MIESGGKELPRTSSLRLMLGQRSSFPHTVFLGQESRVFGVKGQGLGAGQDVGQLMVILPPVWIDHSSSYYLKTWE